MKCSYWQHIVDKLSQVYLIQVIKGDISGLLFNAVASINFPEASPVASLVKGIERV